MDRYWYEGYEIIEKLPLVNTSDLMVLGVKNKRKLTPHKSLFLKNKA